jgi:hypothetical protein
VERRAKLRIYERFPARVSGEDSDGDLFEIDAQLDNIGLHGLHMRLARKVRYGADLLLSCGLVPQGIRRCTPRGWQSREMYCAPTHKLMDRMALQFRFNDAAFFECPGLY